MFAECFLFLILLDDAGDGRNTYLTLFAKYTTNASFVTYANGSLPSVDAVRGKVVFCDEYTRECTFVHDRGGAVSKARDCP